MIVAYHEWATGEGSEAELIVWEHGYVDLLSIAGQMCVSIDTVQTWVDLGALPGFRKFGEYWVQLRDYEAFKAQCRWELLSIRVPVEVPGASLDTVARMAVIKRKVRDADLYQLQL